jgi:hypothetical protein
LYSVYQHWDKLKTCVVGKSYPPQFYSFIKNPKLRNLFEKIAIETEEDLDNLEKLLQKFNVKTIRPLVPHVDAIEHINKGERIPAPISMIPRDQMIMIGNTFLLFPYDRIYSKASGQRFSKTLAEQYQVIDETKKLDWWSPIKDNVINANNIIIENAWDELLKVLPANGITRCGKDLYFGIDKNPLLKVGLKKLQKKYFSNYRCHEVPTHGHTDGVYMPVVPGLIVSTVHADEISYDKEFPDWEIVNIIGEGWGKTAMWSQLKIKNNGAWWIKGHEADDELINFVETWLRDWVGYVEESVFDVNMLMIDEHNVICNGYNKTVFDAFERYKITPHILNLRHRYFWDGGIHCSTLDLDREGTMQDYFPSRK